MDYKFTRDRKVWGHTSHVFCSAFAAVSYLETKAGFVCSRHRHAERLNLFACVEGKLLVEWWDAELTNREFVILEPGDTCSVPSGVYHRFRVIESGKIIEVYWPDRGGVVRHDDIERLDTGGPDDGTS